MFQDCGFSISKLFVPERFNSSVAQLNVTSLFVVSSPARSCSVKQTHCPRTLSHPQVASGSLIYNRELFILMLPLIDMFKIFIQQSLLSYIHIFVVVG